MLEFKTKDELQNCEKLQNMGRYCWKRVILNKEEVIVCTTDQQYEDIIWGDAYEMLETLFDYYNINLDIVEFATATRDFVLDILEQNGVRFVDVFDEY